MAVAKGLLETDLLHLPELTKIHLLQTSNLFLIPALGLRKPVKAASVQPESILRTYTTTPHQVSANSSLKRTQVQRFQGFDINDFADLRESHDMFIDDVFVQWAQRLGVCSHTHFRQAFRADIPWLLRLNTINPTFSCESDYSGTFVEKNEFVILAERSSPSGEQIPVGMVHYYLMWYYPCTGKQREAVRAVYVCTLQRVSENTHRQYVDEYGVDAEPYTGTMLLSLAFLHGKKCGMTMGYCDSTNNSITFYTNQFDMKSLPRPEGRHYTPMQLSLSDYNARNTMLRHIRKIIE